MAKKKSQLFWVVIPKICPLDLMKDDTNHADGVDEGLWCSMRFHARLFAEILCIRYAVLEVGKSVSCCTFLQDCCEDALIALLCVALALLSLSGSAQAYMAEIMGTVYTAPMTFIILPVNGIEQELKPLVGIMPQLKPEVVAFE